jgi:hypothetical protein
VLVQAIREDLVAGKEYSALLFAVQETLVRICIEAGDLLALDAQLEWVRELRALRWLSELITCCLAALRAL